MMEMEKKCPYINRDDVAQMLIEGVLEDNSSPQYAEYIRLLVYSVPSADVAPVRHEEDGTLWVTVEDCEKVGRVIVRNERGHFCRVFYMGDGDEEPVRHGKWKTYKTEVAGRGYFYCTACHVDVYDTSAYCPNCGAKMDE